MDGKLKLDFKVKHLDEHPLFKRLTDDELADDPCIPCVMQDTEEGKKVERNSGQKYLACYVRTSGPTDWDGFNPIYQKADEDEENE